MIHLLTCFILFVLFYILHIEETSVACASGPSVNMIDYVIAQSMNMAPMIEPNDRVQSEKNILNFKLISHDKNYSKFNMHPPLTQLWF